MPIVQIATNIGKRLGSPFLKNVTRMVAEMTNKPEKAVVVMHNFNYEMWYDDSEAPLAHIRFTSLGMSISDHAHYSAKFAELINRDLGVATERVVVYFSSPEPTHIGKNGSTIAEIRKNQDN